MGRLSPLASYLSLAGTPAWARTRMLGGIGPAALRRGRVPRAVSGALATTTLGRLTPEERVWIERVEARRAELSAGQAQTRADYGGDAEGLEWAAALDGPMPLWGATTMMSIPPLWGRFLFHLVRRLRPVSCIELGTAFGLSTAYQASALELNGAGRMLTLDAAREWGAIASEGLAGLGLSQRVELVLGQIDSTLDEALERAAPVDFVFVDAEHQEAPTLAYFERMLPHLAEDALVLFDDIRFPREMRRAWRAIQNHGRVGMTVGLGRMGAAAVVSPAAQNSHQRS